MNHQKNASEEENILRVTKAEQYRTVDELFSRSKANALYYTLLVLSSLIVASGLLLGNSPVVIGGMLITPVLSPVLVIALGLATGEPLAMKSAAMLVTKSFLIVIGSAVVLSLIFGTSGDGYVLENTMRSAVLYFVVALASGVAATFGWTRKEIAEVLPGIAIAVSLVPPLSLIGIGLSGFDLELARFFFLVFLFNFVGIVTGSLVVFSLLKFYRIDRAVAKEAEKANGASGK